jgi:hypothetical protein
LEFCRNLLIPGRNEAKTVNIEKYVIKYVIKNVIKTGSSGAQPVCDVRCAPAGTRTRTVYYGVRKVSGNAEGPRGAYFIPAPLYIRPSWVKHRSPVIIRCNCVEIC